MDLLSLPEEILHHNVISGIFKLQLHTFDHDPEQCPFADIQSDYYNIWMHDMQP